MKIVLFYIVLLAYLSSSAQTLTIIDNSTREPISDVLISDKNNKVISTNNVGKAEISSLDLSGDIVVYHPSYSTYVLNSNEKTEISSVIRLSAKMVILDEIVLSANRSKEHKIDVPYTINVLHQKEIEFVNQATSADLLQNTGAVFVQKSQMGGGSPILRGFEANKVLIVVDGVRMNNAIYRGGHLQDVITLDANMLERTEVLFGPASTIYGSDALGGVMHFYTKNTEFSSTDKLLFKSNAFVRYGSVNQEKTGHIDFNLGWKKFASITNITFSDFNDLLSGSNKLKGSSDTWDRNFYSQRFNNRDSMVKNENPNLQVGTAYSQLDIMQRFSLKTGPNFTHDLNLQLSQSSNIPRYDRLTELDSKNIFKFAEWNYGPQTRFFSAYTFNFDKNTRLSDNVRVIAALQKIQQDRISRSFQSDLRESQLEDVSVISVNVDVFKKVIQKHEIRYGTEMQLNNVVSTANNLNITSGDVTPAATRYADGGNKMNTLGIYISDNWEVNKKFVISDGIRYTANRLESKFTDTTFYQFPFSTVQQNNQALTLNFGITFKEENNYKLSLLMNSGFRTPNIDDMSKVFESNNSILIVPNANIQPEYAYNYELNMNKVIYTNYKFDLTGFYTFLDNALVQSDYQVNGMDSIVIDGDTMKIQSMQNKDRAYIYGFSAGVQFDFTKSFSFKSIFNFTYGRYKDNVSSNTSPLDHIPPMFGQSSLIFKEKNIDVEFFARYNTEKKLSDYSNSGEDNLKYATPNGMPGWYTLNIRLGYSISKNWRINGSCENITDNRYRVFASGVNAPGRNFIISLRYKI